MITQPENFALANEVTKRLARYGDVAIYLRTHEGLGHRGMRESELQRPVAAPASSMQAAVHNETDGSPGHAAEHAHPLNIIGVEAELVREAFGVKAPALTVRNDAERSQQQRQVRYELQPGELGMVARYSLMERRAFQRPAACWPRASPVEQVRSGARAVAGGRRVHGRCAGLGHVQRHRLDNAGRRQWWVEHARRQVLRARDRGGAPGGAHVPPTTAAGLHY